MWRGRLNFEIIVRHAKIREFITHTTEQRLCYSSLTLQNQVSFSNVESLGNGIGKNRANPFFKVQNPQAVKPYTQSSKSWHGLKRFYSTLDEKNCLTEKESNLLSKTPDEFLDCLIKNGIQRCFVVFDQNTGKPSASHKKLEELATFFESDSIDYKNHEGVFLAVGTRTKCLLGAFVWRTCRGQACGGIRLWQYSNMEKYLRDGLRLGFGMGVKSALAGLWAGGGKGVIAEPNENKHQDPDFRRQIFLDYGDFLSSLNGCYVAAEDVGLCVQDLDHVHSRTRYTTCFNQQLGGSGNPSIATGKGIISAMEGALDFLGRGTVENKKIVIQGAGNVAVIVMQELLERNVGQIIVTDCNQKRVDDVKDMFSADMSKITVSKVPLDSTEIFGEPCDILSPCALGNVLTKDTIPHIQAKIVCGAASNQLGTSEDSQLFVDRGILYVPDFLANRMGIVNCANESYGRLPNDPAIECHFNPSGENSIFQMTKTVLQRAADDNITPEQAAMDLADMMSSELHPIWPNRSQQIIDSLVKEDWHLGKNFWAE